MKYFRQLKFGSDLGTCLFKCKTSTGRKVLVQVLQKTVLITFGEEKQKLKLIKPNEFNPKDYL